LQVLTAAVARAGINTTREDKLLSAIGTLNACVGSCETILRYPIPLSYTRCGGDAMAGKVMR
jgi:predicted membrane chloride channel (bestrophin family)